MRDYDIIIDPIEFLSGTTNRLAPVYLEATKVVEGKDPKSIKYIKGFIQSIERVADKSKNDKISSSKGNINRFSDYKNIKTGLEILSSNVPGEKLVKDLKTIVSSLEGNQHLYVEGYSKHIRLIELEYESAVYMVVTGISFALAAFIDIEQSKTNVKIVKKNGPRDHGIISKNIEGLAKELNTKAHKQYLSELIKAKDNVPVSTKLESVSFMEGNIGDTLDLIRSMYSAATSLVGATKSVISTLYRTVFGILPLINSILYLRYKRKADSIISLEEQIGFIELNISQLKNIKTMDEKKKKLIIKKQEAVIAAYRKKSEKLRAELIEAEKDTAVAIKENDKEIKKDGEDDEFILD